MLFSGSYSFPGRTILGKLRIMDRVIKMDFWSFEGYAHRRYSIPFSFSSTFNTLMVCRRHWWYVDGIDGMSTGPDRIVFLNLWSAQKSVICRRCKNNREHYRTLERSNVAIDSYHPIPHNLDLTILKKINHIYILDRWLLQCFLGECLALQQFT